MIFNHVQIKVPDLKSSRQFYDVLMQSLNLKVVLNEEPYVIGYGTSVHDMFEIAQSSDEAPLSHHVHIAFQADNKDMVEHFYHTALDHGATCNGKPGYRPQYEEGYYAAFIICPNGHNLEAVYSEQ